MQTRPLINELRFVGDCSVSELVAILIQRYYYSNGWEFITPEQRALLLLILADKETPRV